MKPFALRVSGPTPAMQMSGGRAWLYEAELVYDGQRYTHSAWTIPDVPPEVEDAIRDRLLDQLIRKVTDQ